MPTALITGASRGFGHAVTRALAARGWDLIVDARDAAALRSAIVDLPGSGIATVVAGSVADPAHRAELASVAGEYGRLDLLLNNASTLGPSPRPRLERFPPDAFATLLQVNTVAPLALTQAVLPQLRTADGTVVNVTSDVAVEVHPGWGGYAASKAALEHLTATLAAEEPRLAVYAFDPGDMRTAMHQAAFPDEDVSDRPEPESVVPAFLRLLDTRPTSGRYAASELSASVGVGA